MEISKHPKMGDIITAIREIAKEIPCDDCKALRDDLNATKSRMTHWKENYDTLKENLQGFIDELEATEIDDLNAAAVGHDFYEKVKKTLEDIE